MKILLLTGKMENGGAETHVYDLARGLVKRGHSVMLISSGGRYAQALRDIGVKCVEVATHKKTPLALLALWRTLKRAMSGEAPDVVHSHTRITSYVASFVCKNAKIPLITTAHAHFPLRGLLNLFSRWGDATVAVSHDIGQNLLNSGKAAYENITVIPNGVDTENLVPSEADVKNKICFLSRLDSDCCEAALSLCRIAPSLAQKTGDVSIYIGGDGDQLPRIQDVACKVNGQLGKTVIYTVGRVTDVAEFLFGAAVFVGVSRAALEAMSCGVPVVLAGNEGYLGAVSDAVLRRAEATNLCCRGEGKIEDCVLDGDIFRLIEMGEEERRELSEKLREYVEEHHSVEKMTAQTERVYEKYVRQSHKDKRGVLLCGYYGFDNMGDDALLRAAVRRAEREYPNASICALTKNGKRDSRKFGIRCVCRHSPTAVAREIRRAQAVVFGGGTLLQNGTSRRSLAYYLKILSFAQSANIPTELWGNGIDSVRGRRFRKMTARALSECRYVGLRDRESMEAAVRLIRHFGYEMPLMALEDDLAFGTPSCEEDRLSYILSALGLERDTPIAVIAIRGTEKKGYRGIMGKHISALVTENIIPVFLPMFPSEDLEVCRSVCDDRGGVIVYPIGVSDAVALIRHATVVLAMRYHALVFAASVGTPFVGYGSEPKIERFCRSNGGKYFTQIV